MSSAAALRDLAETLDDPRSETLLHVAREVEDVVDALMAAESALDHARRTADPETAIVLHGAIFGSYERFIGILIEHFAGKLPVWLAPTQAVVATIVSDADHYAREVVARLEGAGIRVEADLRNEKINYKVREHSLAKVPHLLVVGKREAEEGKVAVRTLGAEHQKVMTLDEALAMLTGEATAPDLR
jgi:threonyl-tRNA synthetase